MSFSSLGSSASSANQSLAWVMGNGGKGHIVITFPFALDSGWYSEQACTEFLHFEHRKERKGFRHEFIVLRLINGSLCRIERMGDPNARLNAISSRGSTAHDMVQTFLEKDMADLKTSDVVAEITLPFKFDIMDVLKVCRAIHEGEITRNYTLQVYNCWFFSLAIQVCLARLIAYWEDPELLGAWLSKLGEGIDALIEHPELGRLLQTQKIFKIYPMLAPFGNDGEKGFMEEVGARLKSRLMEFSGDLRAELRCRINDLLWYSTIRADLSSFIKQLVEVTIVELLQERFLTVPHSYHGAAKSLEQLKYQLLALWTSLLSPPGTRTTPIPTQFQSKGLKEKSLHPTRDTPPRGRFSELGTLPKSTPVQFQLNQKKPANHVARESPFQHSDSSRFGVLSGSTSTGSQLENEREQADRGHAAHDSPLMGGVGTFGAQYKSDGLAEEEQSINTYQFLTLCKPYLGQIVAWLLDAISLIWGITILAPRVALTIDQQLEAMVTKLEGLRKISCFDLERVIHALCALTEKQAGLWFNSPWDNICSFLEDYAIDNMLKALFKPKVDFFAKYRCQEKPDSETIILFQDHVLERIKIHAQEVERNWLGSAVDLQVQLEDVLSLVWKRIREDESLTEKVSRMKPPYQTLATSGDIATPAQTDTSPLPGQPKQTSVVLDDIATPAKAVPIDPLVAAAVQPLRPNQAAKERPDGKGTFFSAGGAILKEFDKSHNRSREPLFPNSSPTDLQPTKVSGIGGKVSKPDYSESKIVVVMVGLPARGKSYLSNKLARYLKWLEYDVEVFNFGQLRRSKARAKKEKSGITEDHTASYFSHSDDRASQLRDALAEECLESLIAWLKGGGNVAIHDATNSTNSRRQKIASRVAREPGLVALFLESYCDDPAVIAANVALKISSRDPDYAHMSREDAERDYKNRIKHYESVYETMTEPHLSYVKIINVGSQVQMYRVHGHLQSRIAFYLMNLHLKPRSIFMSRHGESQSNVEGKIGGDAPLSARGRRYAAALPNLVRDNIKDAELTVWTSTLQRTIETASQLPYPKLAWKSLDELDAGVCDGMTYEEIEAAYPEDFEARDDNKFNYRYRGGESYRDVVVRLEPVIMELERQDNVLVIAHQAIIRCLYAYFHNISQEELPYINIPLHTVIKLTPEAHGCDEERYTLPIGAASTHRPKPKSSAAKTSTAPATSA